MPRRDNTIPGAPCWIDLMTSDPTKARAFYGELFGWTSEEGGPEFGNYITFSKDGGPIAGAMHNDGSSGAPDGWSIYLLSDDAKATVDAAQAAGSDVTVAPMDVGDLGTMAVVTDPGGAQIGIWKPGTHAGIATIQESGTPGWFELHTRDYDKSVAFYTDVFKWDAHTTGDTDEFRYTTLKEGDEQQAGIMDASGFLPDGVPAHWSIYFLVDDTDATLARIAELGGAKVQDAEDTPYGRLAVASDPTGAQFKLVAN